MSLEKSYKLEFVDVDYEGNGVAKIDDNFPIFVPGVLKGEKAIIEITEEKKKYARAKAVKVVSRSPYRVFPECPHYENCGGCNLMHLAYPEQLEFKKHLVKDTIRRISGLDVPVENILGSDDPFHYRNKLEFHFSFYKDRIRAGFYNEKSHQVVDISTCLVEPKVCLEIIAFLKSVFKINGVPIYKEKDGRGCVRHVVIKINQKKEIMVIFVTNTHYLKKEEEIVSSLTKKFPNIVSIALSFNPAKENLHSALKTNILWGSEYLEEKLMGLDFVISPDAFFQVNLKQTEKLYSKVLEYADLKGTENVIDAYCGIGSISLCLAKKAKYVYGIEIIEGAINSANINKNINNINNVEFILGPCEEKIQQLANRTDIDLLVVDPPRKGLEKEFIDFIDKMNIKKIIYVSCNVRTLSRDLLYLSEYNYVPTKATPVDMFPQTTHVETIVLLELK